MGNLVCENVDAFGIQIVPRAGEQWKNVELLHKGVGLNHVSDVLIAHPILQNSLFDKNKK